MLLTFNDRKTREVALVFSYGFLIRTLVELERKVQ